MSKEDAGVLGAVAIVWLILVGLYIAKML